MLKDVLETSMLEVFVSYPADLHISSRLQVPTLSLQPAEIPAYYGKGGQGSVILGETKESTS
jgi:hypothetical protein